MGILYIIMRVTSRWIIVKGIKGKKGIFFNSIYSFFITII